MSALAANRAAVARARFVWVNGEVEVMVGQQA